MNNAQLQEAIKTTQELAMNKDAWGAAKELAITHLRKLYEVQAIRAGLAPAPRFTFQETKK
jgi:hypothetical protein